MVTMATVPEKEIVGGGKMPMVGLGTWKSATGEVTEAVKAAIDVGYRHIDCALVYGNEPEVGEGIKCKITDGTVKREDLFVVSKLWNAHHEPKDVRPMLQKSLSNLGLDYLDLYLIHWPVALKPGDEMFPRDADGNILYHQVPHMDIWRELEKCVDDGLVKSIGLSNFNSVQIQNILDNCRIKPSNLQVEIHPFFSQEKLVKFCHERGVTVTAYSPLGSPDRPWVKPGEPTLLDDPNVVAVAKKCNKSPAQVILRWLLQRDIIIIPKSITPSRIKENLEIIDFELSADDMKVIDGFNRDCRLVVPMVTDEDGKRVFRDRDAPDFPFLIEF